MGVPGFAPRLAAAEMLKGVLEEGRLLSDLVQSSRGPLASLPPQGRARAQSLATDTLRHLGRIDTVLNQFLQKEPPALVRNALRLATCEMVVDGIAPHAAVDAAVRMVKNNRQTTHLAGLTNAVARRVAENGRAIWPDLEPTSLPPHLAKPLTKVYGAKAVSAFEAAHEAGAPLDISLHPSVDVSALAEALNAEILPTGSLRLQEWGQISAMPGFDEGAWWVQDAAAAIPANLLGDIKEKTVLDLCAAPGGKTMQLAAAGAKVTALDLSATRMERLRENLARVELQAEVLVEDVLEYAPDKKFDAILLDAPCSATGTIRRHPDLPYAKADLSLNPLLNLQKDMLAEASKWLKPGGELVYCTCSLFPEEGEAQIEAFLETHPEFEQNPALVDGLNPDWLDSHGGLRLRPDYWHERGGMDGFYIARLKKKPQG
ncbi:MAG: methyltransferase domain-containing protein [Rhodobacteraceae bacterium]|nr:methyltransferase domain-containing protein [Paracoccaceae bacterium]